MMIMIKPSAIFVVVGFIHEDRLRELLTTMGDRFTDEEVMHFLIINSYVTGTVAGNTGLSNFLNF